MNDTFLNKTGLQYYHNRIKNEFASQDDFDELADTVQELVVEGGEPNVIDTVKVNNVALVPDQDKAVNIDLSGYAETSDLPEYYVEINTDTTTGTLSITDSSSDQNITTLTPNANGLQFHNEYEEVQLASTDYVDENGGRIQKIKVNGVEQTISQQDKSVDITVPTKVSDLTNDSNFIDNTVNNLTNYYTKSETYTQAEVDALVAGVASLNIEVVQTLPTQDISKTTIYLVPKSTVGTNNTYDEYINTTGTSAGWEKIGDTEIDLSNYWNSTNLVAITTAEIDTIVAGS